MDRLPELNFREAGLVIGLSAYRNPRTSLHSCTLKGRISDTGEEDCDMTSAEEQDVSGPNAPLLPSPSSENDTEYDESLACALEYSGGWFIWALTFSAGISGLLFGYEYVCPFKTCYCPMLLLQSLLTMCVNL